jgi:predicted secreted protein
MASDDLELTIETAVGPVEIPLEESPSSGYRWSLAAAPAGVTVEDSRWEPSEPGRMAGGGGTRIFVVRAERPGVHVLRFELARGWERDAPLQTCTVRLDVHR